MAPSAHGDADSFLGRSRSSFAGLPPPEPPALEPMSPQYGIQDTMITALLSQTRAPEPTPLHLKRPQSAMRAQEQEPPLALALRRPSSAPPGRRPPRPRGRGVGDAALVAEGAQRFPLRRRSTPVVVSGLGAHARPRARPVLHPTARVGAWVDPFAAGAAAPRAGLRAAPSGTRPRYRATPEGRRSPRARAGRPVTPNAAVGDLYFGDLECGVMGVSARRPASRETFGKRRRPP